MDTPLLKIDIDKLVRLDPDERRRCLTDAFIHVMRELHNADNKPMERASFAKLVPVYMKALRDEESHVNNRPESVDEMKKLLEEYDRISSQSERSAASGPSIS